MSRIRLDCVKLRSPRPYPNELGEKLYRPPGDQVHAAQMAAVWRQGEYEEGESPLVSEKGTATSNSRTVRHLHGPGQTRRSGERSAECALTRTPSSTATHLRRGNADSFRKGLYADLLGRTPGNLGGTPGWKIKVITRTCLKKGRNQFQTLGYVKKAGPVRVEQFNGECARSLPWSWSAGRPGRSAASRSCSRGLSLLPPWAFVRPPSESARAEGRGKAHRIALPPPGWPPGRPLRPARQPAR